MAATALLLITGVRLVQPAGGQQEPGFGRAQPAAVLMGGGKVLGLLSETEAAALAALSLTPLDGAGLLAVPGFIDMHVHVCGGGGETGPSSRTPEARLSELLLAGITTVCGITGTDSVSRSQENLIAKVRGLGEDGLTALHWCGSYRLPAATATGGVQRELCLVDSCIGVGEVAVSDHRGSAPTPQDLLQLALEARVGGMLSGKAGIVHCHMGPGRAGMQPLCEALAASSGGLPITAFHPTHMARSRQLVEEGAAWLADGGTLDLTCGVSSSAEAVPRQGVPLAGVTVSTDSYGSLPVFDEQGRLVQYDVADPGAMLRFVQLMVLEEGWPLEEVLLLVTSNPARILRLPHKGRVAVGADADILLLQEETLALEYVIAKREVVKTPEWVRGGMFERGPGIRPRQPPVS